MCLEHGGRALRPKVFVVGQIDRKQAGCTLFVGYRWALGVFIAGAIGIRSRDGLKNQV